MAYVSVNETENLDGFLNAFTRIVTAVAPIAVGVYGAKQGTKSAKASASEQARATIESARLQAQSAIAQYAPSAGSSARTPITQSPYFWPAVIIGLGVLGLGAYKMLKK